MTQEDYMKSLSANNSVNSAFLFFYMKRHLILGSHLSWTNLSQTQTMFQNEKQMCSRADLQDCYYTATLLAMQVSKTHSGRK